VPTERDDLLREKLDQANQNSPKGEIDQFLSLISQLESSGGKNLAHKTIESGIHAGDTAIGQYGLMPNTIEEMARRSGRGPASVPQNEEEIARQLAAQVLSRQPSDEMAAFSWNQGHNLSPNQIEERNYQEHPYVQRFQKLKQALGK
jgi:hypothetical protein